jgi:hypothetical protein
MGEEKRRLETLEEYRRLLGKVIQREEQVQRLVDVLESETNWLDAPASTRFHLSTPGGLLEHSVGVAKTLLKLRECLGRAVPEESCVIVGLFHDAGKAGLPGQPYYIKNTVEWEIRKLGKFYTINPSIRNMGIAVRSIYLVSKYVDLSPDEAQAIVYHDGQYIDDNKCVAHRESALTLLVHWADYWTAHVIEGKLPVWKNQRLFTGPAESGLSSVQTELWSSKDEGEEL